MVIREVRDMFNTQGTTVTALQEEYLEILIQAFLETKKAENVTGGTLGFYRKKLLEFLKYCTSQQIKIVSQISPSTIREFLLFLRERQHNNGGVHCFYRVVKTFLRWYEFEFEPEGWRNPIRKVKAPMIAIEPLEPVDYSVMEAMMKACGKDMVGRRNRAMMYVLADTGTRASEMLGVMLADIDILTGECLIKSGKGRKPRFVFLGQIARRSLRQYLKLRHDKHPALWITQSGDGALSYWGLVSDFKRLAEKAGVKKPSIHSFRYFWTLKMLSKSDDLLSISRLGGWSNLQMLQRYAKQSKADLRAKAVSPVDELK
jgi:site-specific recombinase XerD